MGIVKGNGTLGYLKLHIILFLAAALLSLPSGDSGGTTTEYRLPEIQKLLDAGKFAEGLKQAQEIAALAESKGDSLQLATALLRISDAYYYLGDKDSTLPPMQRALKIYLNLDDLEGIGRSYYSLAYYYERSDPQQMIELLKLGLSYAEKAQDDDLIMNIANATGVARWNQGQYDLAIQAYEKSLALARKNHLDQALASANQNVGLIHLNQGRPLVALRFFDLALAASDPKCSTHNLATIQGNRGNAFFDLHDFEQAMSCYREAVRIHSANGYQRGQAIYLDNIAKIHRILGEWDPARESLLANIKTYQHLGDTRNLVLCYTSLGNLSLDQQDWNTAGDYFELALDLASEYGDPYLFSGVEMSLGLIEKHAGHNDAAWHWLADAEGHAREMDDSTILGQILATKAVWIVDSGDRSRGINLLEEAIGLHEISQIKTHSYLWHSQVARWYYAEGDLTSARQQFEISLDLVDQLNSVIDTDRFRLGFFQEVAGVYHYFAFFLAKNGDALAGMKVLDRGRARVLSIRLQPRGHGELRSDENVWEARNLTSSTLQVSFSALDDTLLVFSFRAGVAHCRVVPEANVLLQRARMFGEIISDPSITLKPQAAGRSLFQELLEPEFSSGEISRLMINPDGDLWTFPFSALVTQDDRFLGQDISISLVPAWSILTKLSGQDPISNQRALVVVKSHFEKNGTDQPRWPDIPGALVEARTVCARFQDGTLLADATETRFKELATESYEVIHLATHTVYDDRDPLKSGAVLGVTSQDDGLLRAEELYDLDLTCNLGVISSCQSGSGKVVTGEGLLGMTHGLLSSGCRSVVLSRWEVADRAALFFMSAFYDALAEHAPDEALTLARMKMLDSPKWNHPSNWAAYYLAGDASCLTTR